MTAGHPAAGGVSVAVIVAVAELRALGALGGVLGVLGALGGCGQRPELASCDDDLRGVYLAEGKPWMVLDEGATLEAYPLFPDGDPAPGDVVVAPRVIDLARGSDAGRAPGTEPLRGTLRRRYMRRAERCDAQVAVHVTRCAADTLELVLADPAPPLAFSPCTWPGPAPSRVVRWRRE
ncbi:MAG TPA: hypothetical protein VFT22_37225 [Kofleriaceae bacterium]|nr:hypothetical protein [Kofleriaceae bacterium]